MNDLNLSTPVGCQAQCRNGAINRSMSAIQRSAAVELEVEILAPGRLDKEFDTAILPYFILK